MTSRCVKLVLLLVLGAGLAFTVSPAAAAPLVLDWEAIGTGGVGGTCAISPILVAGCQANSGGDALGKHVGSSTWTLSVNASATPVANASGGNCFVANGTGTVTAANGDVINFTVVGWLCEEGIPGTAYHYNATYRIFGGTGRFGSAVGGGNLSSTNVRGGASFLKIDGTINF
jgi:hypothetical protein